MDIYVQASSSVPLPSPNVGHEVPRRSANFHPSIWGDYFLEHASDFKEIDSREVEEHEQLKKDLMKKLLAAYPNTSLQKLNLIDSTQRLGVSYHFESHIEASLQCIYDEYEEYSKEDEDLYVVALRFRLLRQQGHPVSCDIFKKFKDQEGNFDKSLVSNTEGILSLYEAAHFRVHGEDILEEALTFATAQLESSQLLHSSTPLAAKIVHSLKLPINKSLTRVGAKEYISIYEQEASHNESLLKFVKLDFHILQKMHQKELSGITMWWKSLEVAEKLPFVRDRLVECYFFALGVYFEPQYCLARSILTKVLAMSSIIDDINDVYGTYNELEVFTDAIERWDAKHISKLPSYMQVCYGALLDVYHEIEKEMAKEGRLYAAHVAKAEMKKLVRAYFAEANWFNNNYTPTVEEHMKVALVSCGYMMLSITSFLGMGERATKDVFDWVTSEPLMVKASSRICRLTDDMVGHEFEQERGHVASAVECYMNQYGASKQDAYNEFNKQVTNAWKDLNAESLHLKGVVPVVILMRILNFARVINLLYEEEDGYTHSKTKSRNLISSLLVDPIIT